MKRKKTRRCDDCKENPATHQVMHGGIDTGIVLCCSCMDRFMEQLSRKAVPLLEGSVGLLKFRKEHVAFCGYIPSPSTPESFM